MENLVLSRATLDWLLPPRNPSVRFLALTELLGEPAEGGEAARARREIMTQGAVPLILAAQNADGHSARAEARFYNDKYTGTVWQLIILAELGADPGDARVRAACEAILRDSQHPDSGGFSVETSRKAGGGLASGVIPCLTGNLVFSLIRLGYLDDPRLQRAVDWIATWQRFDDGDSDAPDRGPYDPLGDVLGTPHLPHGSRQGAQGARRDPAGASLPRRPAHPRRRQGVLPQAPRPQAQPRPPQTAKPGWRRFQFPLMYQTDVLELLGIFAKLGAEDASRPSAGTAAIASSPLAQMPDSPLLDPRAQEALDLVEKRQDEEGRWWLPQTFNGRFPRRHRDQGRAQPLDHVEGAAGAEGGRRGLNARAGAAAPSGKTLSGTPRTAVQGGLAVSEQEVFILADERCSRSRCSGRDCRRAPANVVVARVGEASSNALLAIIIAGVQNPHCRPSSP